LLVFLLVSAAIDEENYFTFRWLWQWSSIGQGHHAASIKQRTGDLERRIAIAYFFGATIFAGNDRRVVDGDRPACD
jgi:hypothetical protein